MKADILIKGSAIFDSVKDEPFEGFVAIKDKKILKVGSPEEAEAYIGLNTEIIESGDRTVMPGFHDSHTHLILAGMFKAGVQLYEAKSEEEAAKMVKDYYEKYDDGNPWVYGFNWYHIFWDKKELPKKETLDAYFPDRPVFLLNSEAHGAWVNSKALELAGITKDTPDPFGGEFSRDENGEPAGFLYEAAIAPVIKYAFDFTAEQEKNFLKQFMTTAAPLGITAVVDVQPYFGQDLGSLDVYTQLEEEGELTVRITSAGDLLGDVDKAVERSKKYKTEKVRAHMLKQFVDGVFPTHTALMLEDYTDAPGNKGTSLSQLEDIREGILRGHEHGLWIKIHAIGDRAIKFTVDCYEEAIEKHGKNDARHAVEHIELPRPEDIKRFGELGLVPSIQPEHVGLMPTWEGEEYRYVLGEERANRTWPFKSLLESAGVIAVGSDCPVVDNSPFPTIYRGITRLHNDGLPEGGWNPTEKLTLSEVLKGYTSGSAYGIGREAEMGTLEEGKFADVIIIDKNLFAATPDEIRESQVDMTIMDGKIIYHR
ncbi:MAG: amidohydrolase [Anaerovoracaceae bacterium]